MLPFHLNIRVFLTLILLSLLSTSLAACSSSHKLAGHHHAMAHPADFPNMIQTAPGRVREAYQFAAANPEMLDQIPCYCGCAAMGHTSNYDCYVQNANSEGEMSFDQHALGCTICVDITHDVMRMMDEDVSIPEIYTSVEENYAIFGTQTFKESITKRKS